MRVEKSINHFFISKGRKRESYFCFYVDDDSACWTSMAPWQARQFATMKEANNAIGELKRREHLRRRRKAG